MRVAIYARVSTEAQEARGTIGSQLDVLRAHIAAEGHQLCAEFCDDGYSGARLDRPGLDALRDAAEAGLIEAVWCLSPDRLARAYAYQVVVLDELERLGVRVLFVDTPPLEDPQARLLTQVQGVISEYERAKIAERYRRGKLYRSRAGEVISWKAPYGYRRVARSPDRPAHLEVFEPEAAVVRRIFDYYVVGGHSMREITRRLNADAVATPTGKPVWGTSTVGRLLRNEAYVGRVYYNRTESTPTTSRTGRRSTVQRPRPKEEWIAIAVSPIVAEDVFEAAQATSRDNSRWSPRRVNDEAWLLRGLIVYGSCGVRTNCHRMQGRNGTFHRYYWCRNHDTLRAGGEDRRCPQRNIRADALDAFVFDQVRAALLRPDVLLAGERAVALASPAPDDEILAAELARLDRKVEAADAERRRLADLYQAGLLDLQEVQRRCRDVDARRQELAGRRDQLVTERRQLVADNELARRVRDFAARASAGIDNLDFKERQQLVRLVVDEVHVNSWQVTIHLRIALEPDSPNTKDANTSHRGGRVREVESRSRQRQVSSEDGLRSLRVHRGTIHRRRRNDEQRARRTVVRADAHHREEKPPWGGRTTSDSSGGR
jgi:site-specific DNA recombinase